MQRLRQHKFFLFLCLLFSCIYLYFFTNRAYVEITIDSPEPTSFKIYWSKDGQPYSEKNRSQLRIEPPRTQYGFFLTDLTRVTRLRIDPHQHSGSSTLKKISIQQAGFKPLILANSTDFSRLKPLFGIDTYTNTDQGLHVESQGNDPQFEIIITPEKSPFHPSSEIFRIMAMCLLLWLIYTLGSPLVQNLRYVPVLLAVILTLIILMTTTSAENTHPDEYVHLDAARYYQDHWLPPDINDPAIRHTYSVYGVSRLNTNEVSYLLTGKFANLFKPFHIEEYQTFRFFNVFLFGGILLFVLYRPQTRAFALPFLLTPQLWYTFSYCNSDAFAFFIYFFAGCLIILPESLFNRTLREEFSIKKFHIYIFFALFFALLLLVKKNYYILLFFYLCFYIWKNHFIGKELKKEHLIRLLVLFMAGLTLSGIRIAGNYYVNGLDRATRLAAIQEELAEIAYKPSTELHKKHMYLYMKARGNSLERIIKFDRWFAKTFRSTFGVYGYFTISAPDCYYQIIQWIGTSFLLFFIGSVVLRGGPQNNLLLFIGLGFGGGLIAISLWHSWTSDFQAQGRYLFPILLLFSVMYFETRGIFQKKIFNFFTLSMATISLYSFIFVALQNIPRHIFP